MSVLQNLLEDLAVIFGAKIHRCLSVIRAMPFIFEYSLIDVSTLKFVRRSGCGIRC